MLGILRTINPKTPDRVCDNSNGCNNYCMGDYDETTGCYTQGNWNICGGISQDCVYHESIEPEQPPEDLPKITLAGPEDLHEENSPVSIDFSFTVETSSQFETCELIIDDVSVAEKNRPIYLSTQILTNTPEEGEHEWKIKCILRETYGGWAVNSETRTLTIGEVIEHLK